MLSPSSPRAISSTASCTRCRVVKSQFTPSNSGLPLFKRTRGGFSRLAVGSFFGEELMKHRKDLSAVADALHRKMAVRWQDLAVGAPQVALARGDAINAFADLDIGKILTERQHLAAQELDAMAAIGPVIVAVGGLGSIDVPGIERIALAGDLQHFLERRRDDGTASLAAIEEGLLVDLLGRAGMADEDDVDGAIVPLERLDLGGLRPAQRDAPGHAIAHGAADAEVGRRPRHRVAGAEKIGRVGLLQRLLDQIRQLEILEEHVEELFAGEGEL